MQLAYLFHQPKNMTQADIQENMRARHDLATAVGTGLITAGVKLGMSSVKSDLSFDEVDLVSKDMIKTHNLDKKGLTHIYLDDTNEKKAIEKTVEGIKKHEQYKQIGSPAPNDIAKNLIKTVKKGLNAFYIRSSNFAVTAKKKAYLMPHELGHAINANSGKAFNNIILKTKNLHIFAPTLLFLNAVNNDTNKESGSKTKKVANFLEEHATALTFASFVPLLTEEGLASKKAIKHAKKVLGKGKLGTFKKSYGIGYASYLGATATATMAMKWASQEKKTKT